MKKMLSILIIMFSISINACGAGGRSLTPEEINWFNAEFFCSQSGEVWSQAGQFLVKEFDSIEDVELDEVFYNGMPEGDGGSSITEEELAYLQSVGAEMELDMVKVTKEYLEQNIERYLGVSLKQIENESIESFHYWEEYETYFLSHSDTNMVFVRVLEGQQLAEDTIELICAVSDRSFEALTEAELTRLPKHKVVLKQCEDTYCFVSNTYLVG